MSTITELVNALHRACDQQGFLSLRLLSGHKVDGQAVRLVNGCLELRAPGRTSVLPVDLIAEVLPPSRQIATLLRP